MGLFDYSFGVARLALERKDGLDAGALRHLLYSHRFEKSIFEHNYKLWFTFGTNLTTILIDARLVPVEQVDARPQILSRLTEQLRRLWLVVMHLVKVAQVGSL